MNTGVKIDPQSCMHHSRAISDGACMHKISSGYTAALAHVLPMIFVQPLIKKTSKYKQRC
jgi:hypothetical protein